MRAGAVLAWSLAATIVLVAVGVFGTLLATGRITLIPAQTPAATSAPTAEPVVDTSFSVTVLNATTQAGLAGTFRDMIVQAGWPALDVDATDSEVDDFPHTTVYYARPEDEGAARGLAQAIGGAVVELNDSYQPVDDPATDDVDEGAARQLVLVVGLDRTEGATAAPAA